MADEQTVPEKQTEEPKAETPPAGQAEMSPTDLWGDQRMNPLFLKTLDYFGVGEKDFRNAESEIRTIIDWAAAETKSKNISDILLKIADTSKLLQSPGMGERRYAILYRYVRLLEEAKPIQDQMGKLQGQLDDIEKEKQAYHGTT